MDPRALADVLDHLIDERGFVMPLQCVTVARNGPVVVCSYAEGEDGVRVDIRYSDDVDMVLPINMMIVDSRGEAARVVLGADQLREYFGDC